MTNDESKGKIYHSRGKLNSFGRLVVFYGDKKINVKKRLADRNGHLLILDTEIDGSEYILVNSYNSNTKSKIYLKILLKSYYLYLII